MKYWKACIYGLFTVDIYLQVQHPAAKMIVMASQQQEQEAGDGTNFVIAFAGALCEQAEELLRMGVSVSEVIAGYEMAAKKALEILPCKWLYKYIKVLDVFSSKFAIQ